MGEYTFMNIDNIEITQGINSHQKASIKKDEKTLEYTASKQLSYIDIISVTKGLNVVSEFYDVNCAATISNSAICAVALGKTLEDAVLKTMDSNPIDFINSVIVVSKEVDVDIVKIVKPTNKIVAPSYSIKALELLDKMGICYITIKTPLKDYKNFLPEEVKITPLGTLIQSPNLSELTKDSFKVVSKTKPTVEQIEDAVFAWKIAKHVNSQAIVIAKDLKTSAIAQSLNSASVEFALEYSCDTSKNAILASDDTITVHDVEVVAQERISLVIVPMASNELIKIADKYNVALIVTGFTNKLY